MVVADAKQCLAVLHYGGRKTRRRGADAPQLVRFTDLDDVWVAAGSPRNIPVAIRQVTAVLRDRHHLRAGAPERFQDSRPHRNLGDVRGDKPSDDESTAGRGAHFTHRRRCGHHEHYAGVRDRADARDWHPHGCGGRGRATSCGNSSSKRWCFAWLAASLGFCWAVECR